jgi:GGDEF domain-containing protein
MAISRNEINEMDDLYGDIKAFRIRAQEELRRARRYAAFVSLILFDLSKINRNDEIEKFENSDTFMKSLRQLVRSSIRDTDIISTAGARKMFILLIDTPREGAEAFSERLQKSIRYFMCNNVKSPLNWRVPMTQYSFPAAPGDDVNMQAILDVIN